MHLSSMDDGGGNVLVVSDTDALCICGEITRKYNLSVTMTQHSVGGYIHRQESSNLLSIDQPVSVVMMMLV